MKTLLRKLLKLLPDRVYLKMLFRFRTGKRLDLKCPKTFNEKLQWLKLYDRKPEYTTMVDKYAVKEYVSEKIGEKHIIPTLGAWDAFDDIDFSLLPDQFVLKCTHDSGGLVICRDKNKLDIDVAKKKINKALKNNYFWAGREWPYKNVKPRIIAEKYLEESGAESAEIAGLTDYKFYCFNGIPKYLYVSKGLEDHSTAKISFLTLDWQFAPFKRLDFAGFDSLPPKPTKLDEMIQIARKLADGKKFLRVDLYQVDNEIYFSELTFTPCGGLMPCDPKEWDRKLGDMLCID